MGLDQYLSGRKHLWKDFQNPANDRIEDDHRIKTIVLDLGYWRKHPNLHGYIVQTFGDGRDECQDIELDHHAIKNIINAIMERRLPHTTGFFFGSSIGDDEERDRDLYIFNNALKWLTTVPTPPPLFVDEGQQSKEVHQMAASLGDVGMTVHQVNITELPPETRSIVYRASW